MSLQPASSSKSPPKRLVSPALPLLPTQTRSAAATPPDSSEMDEIEDVSKAVDELTIDNGIGSAVITTDAAKMEPAQEDDVFGASTTTEPPEGVAEIESANTAVEMRPEADTLATLSYGGFTPRPDRIAQLPNALNAQGIYPPQSLIFVANLTNQKPLDQLIASCHQAFDEFGPCHIKVRFDKNRHPFALVQFANIEDADAAVNAASDMLIDGRRIRIERGKAERAVILSRRDGAMISEAEVRGLLEKYGPIELCVPTSNVDRARYNMAPGMYVKFAFYLDCRDALRRFNNHAGNYNLYLAPPLEPRMRAGPTGSPVVRGFLTPRSTVDQKSIYVGNLPDGTGREELEDMFKEFGNIVQVNIIKKHYAEDSVNIFGFVEFSNPREAERASVTERYLHGIKLRVEPKEYSARRPQRTGFFPSTPVRQNKQVYADAGYSGPSMNYNNPDMYAMQQMTTPPGGYNQRYPMPAYHPNLGNPMQTPDSHQGMFPMGMFTPSPAHSTNQYGQPFVNYNSPMYGGHGHSMGPIQEHNEEDY